MNYRDYIQQLIYKITDPLIHLMIRCKITPDHLTAFGFILNLVAAALFCLGGMAPDKPTALTYIGAGGWVILVAGLFDILDGRLARKGGMTSRFGALFDSTMDRYSEIVTLAGLFIFLFYFGRPIEGVITMAALGGSLMVSYVRARAEGLGIECKVGMMQRPERVVITALGTILCGLFRNLQAFDPTLFLTAAMTLIALFANLTAFVRIHHCWKELR